MKYYCEFHGAEVINYAEKKLTSKYYCPSCAPELCDLTKDV